MAKTYTYKARTRTGELATGNIIAENEAAVAVHIREKGYFVTEIKLQRSINAFANIVDTFKRVKTKDLAIFCRQFSTMINAGLPLVSCISTLIEQTESAKLKEALQGVYKSIKEGETLSRSLAQYPRVFPGIMINMTEAGEVGGVLDTVLDRLAVHFEKEHKLNEKVKSAMTYPAVVSVMALLVVIFVLTFVLPTFVKMFDGMKVQLPLPTRILIGLSDFLRTYWLPLLAGALAAGYASIMALRQPKYRTIFDRFILQLPIAGDFSRKVGTARFSRTLSTLIRGGVPILTALEVVKKTIGNLSMIDALTKAQSSVKEGRGLAATLSSSKVFAPMVIQMVAIGEESGTLDTMLEKIADFYEGEVDDMVSRLSSLMEPVIVGVLGVVIGFIVVSVVIPMFDAVTNIGH